VAPCLSIVEIPISFLKNEKNKKREKEKKNE